MSKMISQLIAQFIDQYVREFLGNWDPVANLQIGSLTEPEVNLTNVPLPQFIFELAEIPFIVDYSNIAKVHAKLSWGTFLGRYEDHPFCIDVEDAEIRIRFAYPSEWDAEKWEDKLLRAKLKRAKIWSKFISVFATHTVDKSLAQTVECRIVNALKLRAKNIHIQIVDDHFAETPFCFDIYVAEFNIDSPKADDPRLSSLEKRGMADLLLGAMWMRFVGLHLYFREFSEAVLPDKRGKRCGYSKMSEHHSSSTNQLTYGDRTTKEKYRTKQYITDPLSLEQTNVDSTITEREENQKETKSNLLAEGTSQVSSFPKIASSTFIKTSSNRGKSFISRSLSIADSKRSIFGRLFRGRQPTLTGANQESLQMVFNSTLPQQEIGSQTAAQDGTHLSEPSRSLSRFTERSAARIAGGFENLFSRGRRKDYRSQSVGTPQFPVGVLPSEITITSPQQDSALQLDTVLPIGALSATNIKGSSISQDSQQNQFSGPDIVYCEQDPKNCLEFSCDSQHNKSYEPVDEENDMHLWIDVESDFDEKVTQTENTKTCSARRMFEGTPSRVGLIDSSTSPQLYQSNVTSVLCKQFRVEVCPVHGINLKKRDPNETSEKPILEEVETVNGECNCEIKKSGTRVSDPVQSSNEKTVNWIQSLISELQGLREQEGIVHVNGTELSAPSSQKSFTDSLSKKNSVSTCSIEQLSHNQCAVLSDKTIPSAVKHRRTSIKNSCNRSKRKRRLLNEQYDTEDQQIFSDQGSKVFQSDVQLRHSLNENLFLEPSSNPQVSHSTPYDRSPLLIPDIDFPESTSAANVLSLSPHRNDQRSVEFRLNSFSQRRRSSPKKRNKRQAVRQSTSLRKWRSKRIASSNVKHGRDILPPNDKAFRITPQDGIEMHILYKKWELRALSKYDLSHVHWKNIELSFLPHHPPPGSPKNATKQSNDKSQHKRKDLTDVPLGHTTPVFDGSVYYGPLHVSFTSAALEAFWGFIKFLDLWFVFIKGCARYIRQDPTPQLVDPYFDLWKQKLSGVILTEEELKQIEQLEYQLPLYALLGTREKAESVVYGSMGLAGLARRFKGKMETAFKNVFKVRNSCCRPDAKQDKDEFCVGLNDRITYDRVNDFHWFGRDSYLEVVIPDMRVEIIPEVKAGRHIQGTILHPMSPNGYGPVFSNSSRALLPRRTNVRHQTRSKKRRHSKLAREVRRKERQASRSLRSSLDLFESPWIKTDNRQGSQEYQEYTRSRMPPDAIAHLGLADAFVACASLRYISNKTHDHLKTNFVFVDNLSIIERPVEFLICRTSTVSRREYPINPTIQLPLPAYLIIPRRLPNSKLSLAASLASHHTELQAHLNRISATAHRDIVDDATLRLDDALRWYSTLLSTPFFLPSHNCRRAFISPDHNIPEIYRDTNSAKCQSWTRAEVNPSSTVDAANCQKHRFSSWKWWGGHKAVELPKKSSILSNVASLEETYPSTVASTALFTSKPNIHPESRLSVIIDDVLLASKKKTIVALPHVAVEANRVLKLAVAFPPASAVDRDLFEEVDGFIPDSTLEAQNLGYFCAAKNKTLEIQASKAYLVVKSPVHDGLKGSELLSLHRGFSNLGLSVLQKKNSVECNMSVRKGKFREPLVPLISLDVESADQAHTSGYSGSRRKSRTSQKENGQSTGRRSPHTIDPKEIISPYRPHFRALNSSDDHDLGNDDGHKSVLHSSFDDLDAENLRQQMLNVAPLVSDIVILIANFGLTIAPDKTLVVNLGSCSLMTRLHDEFVKLKSSNSRELTAPFLELNRFPSEQKHVTGSIERSQQPTDSIELDNWKQYNLDFLLTSMRVAYITEFGLIKSGGARKDPSEGPRRIPATFIWSDDSNSNSSSLSMSGDTASQLSASSQSLSSSICNISHFQSEDSITKPLDEGPRTPTTLQLGVATVDIAVGHAFLSLAACCESYAFQGVDFKDIMYRLKTFTAARRINRNTGFAEYNPKLLWRPKFKLVDLGSFEGNVGSSTVNDEEYKRRNIDPVTGDLILADFVGGALWSTFSPESGQIHRDSSADLTQESRKKLDLQVAAGRVGFVIFDKTEARFAFQIFSSYCRFVDRMDKKACHAKISELHMTLLGPTSTTECSTSIVLAKNVVHVGYDLLSEARNPIQPPDQTILLKSLEQPLPPKDVDSRIKETRNPIENDTGNLHQKKEQQHEILQPGIPHLNIYPDMGIHHSKSPPTPPSLENLPLDVNENGLRQLFAVPEPLSRSDVHKLQPFLNPSDMTGSPTPSGSTAAPDGVIDSSGSPSLSNDQTEILVGALVPPQINKDRIPEFGTFLQRNQVFQSLEYSDSFSNPTLEIMERFACDEVPHVSISFSSCESEATNQILGELRSVYLFFSPGLIYTILKLTKNYNLFFSEEKQRGEFCEATLSQSEEESVITGTSPRGSMSVSRSESSGKSFRSLQLQSTLIDLFQLNDDDVKEEVSDTQSATGQPKQLILAITLDNINLHPVYSESPIRSNNQDDAFNDTNMTQSSSACNDVDSHASEVSGVSRRNKYNATGSSKGWPRILSVGQLRGIEPNTPANCSRIAVIDFDNIGIRIMLSIEATISETKNFLPPQRTMRNRVGLDHQYNSYNHDFLERQSTWTKIEIDGRLRRLEVNVLRNATWLVLSMVFPGIETSIAIWKKEKIDGDELEDRTLDRFQSSAYSTTINHMISSQNEKEPISPKRVIIDFVSLDIRQVTLWYASYWDKITGTVAREKKEHEQSHRRLPDKNLPSMEELADLYPRPLSIALLWHPHFVGVANSKRTLHSFASPPTEWTAPHPQDFKTKSDHSAKKAGNLNWKRNMFTEEVFRIIASESWFNQKAGLALPSRPPFSQHVANAQTALLPILYSNSHAATAVTNDGDQKLTRQTQSSKQKESEESLNPNQFSFSYSQRQTNGNCSHFASLHICPTTIVIEPHVIRGVSQAVQYLRFFAKVASAIRNEESDNDDQLFETLDPSIPTTNTDRIVEDIDAIVIDKLASGTKALQAIKRVQEKFSGNLFFDIQLDHIEVIMANVDSIVSAPKVPATLLLHNLPQKTQERYRSYVNGVAIKGLPYFDVVCLSSQSLPTVTLHTGIAVQMVQTQKEDLFPVTYDVQSIASSFNSNFSLISGSPPRRTPLPPLLSLISFFREPPSSTENSSSEDFFAFCIHVPLFSVGLAMSKAMQPKDNSLGWKGLIRRQMLLSTNEEGPASTHDLASVLQLSIGKFDFEAFKSPGTDFIFTSIGAGRVALKDAAGKNLIGSTALLKRYFGSTRGLPGVNFNPLHSFRPLSKLLGGPKTTEPWTNQLGASLVVGPKFIRAGIELHCTRLEIGVDSVQLFDNCVRALLKSIKDMKALAVTFPMLSFNGSQISSALISSGYPRFGFGEVLDSSEQKQETTTSGDEFAQDSHFLPPLLFVSHIPDIFRSTFPCNIRIVREEQLKTKPNVVTQGVVSRNGAPNHGLIKEQVEYLETQLIPKAFQLILFPYDLPSKIKFEEKEESEGSESSEEEGSVRHCFSPPSVFEMIRAVKMTKLQSSKVTAEEASVVVDEEKRQDKNQQKEKYITDPLYGIPETRSVLTLPSEESFSTVYDGRVQARGIKALTDKVRAIFRRKISAESSMDLGPTSRGVDSQGRQEFLEQRQATGGFDQVSGIARGDTFSRLSDTLRYQEPENETAETKSQKPKQRNTRFEPRVMFIEYPVDHGTKKEDHQQLGKGVAVEIDVAIEALEVWVWPLTIPKRVVEPPETGQDDTSMLGNMKSVLSKWRLSQNMKSEDSLVSSETSERTLPTEPSSNSVISKTASNGPIEHAGMTPTPNVVHPRLLQSLRLQTFTTSNDVGTLTGDRLPAKGPADQQPVTGIMISATGHLSRDSSGVRGAVHLVELNVMLGRPEKPSPAPSVRIREEVPTASISIPMDGYFPGPGVPTTHVPSTPDTSSGAGIFRGVRIRKEHRVNFPWVLIGFGGGLFVSSMASKEREDCLFTLQKVLLRIEYVPGPEFALLKHPDAGCQRHCYMNLIVDQPQLHLSLETLWSLDDLLKSIIKFTHTFLGRWKTQPPIMSQHLIELGILRTVYENFHFPTYPNSRSIEKIRNNDLVILSPRTTEGSEAFSAEQGSYTDEEETLKTESDQEQNEQCQYYKSRLEYSTSNQRTSTTCLAKEHLGEQPSTSSNAESGRFVQSKCNQLTLDADWARIAAFAMALGGRCTVESRAPQMENTCADRDPTVAIYEEDEGTYGERLDHKFLSFFYSMCSVGEKQVPLHITAHIDDLSLSLHDAYVQLLQVRIVKTNANAIIPMVKNASISLELLMGLTTYNPLTSSTERALDPVKVHLTLKRRLAGDSEKEDCPWIEISLNIDRLGLDISSGLLQVLRRLQDLFWTARSSTKKLGKMRTVTIYNDIKAPIILLQRNSRKAMCIESSTKSFDWNHIILDEGQCCSTLIDSPMFFAVRKLTEKKVNNGEITTSVIEGFKKFKTEKGHRGSPTDPTEALKAGVETEDDVKRLAFQILKLGNSSLVRHLNDFLRFYQKPLLFGTTRNVEFILELLADQLPMLAGAAKLRWGLSGAGNIFNILRNEPGWLPIGKLRPDYQTNRGYFILQHGFKVVVEPETTASSGEWKLCIGTAIEIVNATNIPFKIFTSKRFGAVRRFARRLQGDLQDVTARSQSTKNEATSPYCIIVNPCSRRSVPLSWFFDGRSPFILPLIEDDQTRSIFSKLQGEFYGRNKSLKQSLLAFETPKSRRHRIGLPVVSGDGAAPFQQLVQPQLFLVLQRLLTKLAEPESDETWKKIAVEDSILKYKRQLAWDISIDVRDIPTNTPNKTAHKCSIRISPYLSLRNSLPFPVTLCIYPSRTAVARGLAASHLTVRHSTEEEEGTSVDDARRMVVGRTMRAYIPPHHIWGIPSQSQRLTFKLFVHGTPIEIFSTPSPIEEAKKMIKRMSLRQDEMVKHKENPGRNDSFRAVTSSASAPLPIYSSTRMSIWLPTSDTQTSKISMTHRKGFSLDDDVALSRFASLCERLSPLSQPSPVTNMYKTFSVTADASRQLITIFAPYFVENLCREMFILFNGRLVPPGSRLYVADEDAKVARVRALRDTLRQNADTFGRLELSTQSGKLDLTSTAVTRSPVVLKFSASGNSRQRAGKARRKLKWATSADGNREDKVPAFVGHPLSEHSDVESVLSGGYDSSGFRDLSVTSPGQNSRSRSHVVDVIPEEDSASVIEDESNIGIEGSDEEDDVDQPQLSTAPSQLIHTGGVSPALVRVRDKFRAALISGRLNKRNDGSSEVQSKRKRKLDNVSEKQLVSDFRRLEVSPIIIEDNADESLRPQPHHRRPQWRPGSILHLNYQSTPSTNVTGSAETVATSVSRFTNSPFHGATTPMDVGNDLHKKQDTNRVDRERRTHRKSFSRSELQPVHHIIHRHDGASSDSHIPTPRQSIPASSSFTSLLSPRVEDTDMGVLSDPSSMSRKPLYPDSAKLAPHRAHEQSSLSRQTVQASQPLQEPMPLKVIIKRSPRSGVRSMSNTTGQLTQDEEYDSPEHHPQFNPKKNNSPSPSIYNSSPPPSDGGSKANASLVVSLGLAVRYANAPYSVSKIISITPRYMFYSRLPFLVLVKDVKASQTLKLGVSRSSKEPQTQLILPSGDCLPFHTAENRVFLQMPAAGRLLTCPPFSLVPSDVPTTFQVELTCRSSSASTMSGRSNIQQVIQVNVVSGNFSEKAGGSGLPYTYNGLFYVFSIPEFPNFQIHNLTRFSLEFISATEKLPVPVDAPAHSRRPSKQRSKRDEVALTDALAREYLEENQPSKKQAGQQRELAPSRRMIYVPHERSNKVNVRIRVMNVKSSSWKSVSLSTVHSVPTVIQFESFASVERPETLYMGQEEVLPPAGAISRHPINSVARGPHQSVSGWATLPREGMKRRLYAFLTVDSRGSRILTITESRRLVERLKAGQVIRNIRGVAKGTAPDLRPTGTMIGDGIDGQQRSGVLRETPRRTENVQLLKKGNPTNAMIDSKYKLKFAQIPWLGISFKFTLPKITLTWTTQSDVILALHLSNIQFSSFVAPNRLARLSGGASALENFLMMGTLGYGDETSYTKSVYWWQRPPDNMSKIKEKLRLQKSYSGPLEQLPEIKIRIPDKTNIALAGATQEERKTSERDASRREWARQRRLQLRRYLDLKTEIFTNSEIRMDFTIGAIHCDHFVEDDVPVILKSTNSGDGDTLTPFFYLHITKSVVDPTFAPIYDDIEITVSPLAVNVELMVVEQLISLGEKEYALLRSGVPTIDEDETLEPWQEVRNHRNEDEAIKTIEKEQCLLIWPRRIPGATQFSPPVLFTSDSERFFESEERETSVVGLHSFSLNDQSTIDPVAKAQFLLPEADTVSQLTNLQHLPSREKELEEQFPDVEIASSWPTDTETTGYAIPLKSIVEMLEHQAAYHSKINISWQRHAVSRVESELDALVTTGVHDVLKAYENLISAPEEALHLATLRGPKRTITKGLRQEAQQAFESRFDILFLPFSGFSHWLIFPSPRWVELKDARPVYIKFLRINSFVLTISIRTSNKRISRQILHIVDALPLDTPYMGVQINSEKRQYAVSTWGELLHSLRNSYLKQLIRQTLPSAWLSNPFAFATGTWRGGRALVSTTLKGARRRSRFPCSIEGFVNGFRLGMVMFFLYSLGGLFQTCSHFGNLLHKALGGSRPRPQGVLDAIWKGIDGFFEDTFVTPWVALYSTPSTAISRGDGCCKVFLLFLGCFLRCLICPVFGLLNFFTSVTEGFANALIGDFEQFARMQEQSDLLAKAQRRGNSLTQGERPRSTSDMHSESFHGLALPHGPTTNILGGRTGKRKSLTPI